MDRAAYAFLTRFFTSSLVSDCNGNVLTTVGLGEPAFAGDPGTQAEEAGVFVPMRFAIDDAFHALAPGVGPEAPAQTETRRVRVQFTPGARFGEKPR